MRFQTTILAWAFNVEKINESSLEIIGALCPGTRRIIISGHQSSKLKTVSSSLFAVPGMTWHRPLAQERFEPRLGTQKRLLPPLLKSPGRRGFFPLQRARVTFDVLMWSTVWDCASWAPSIWTREGPLHPDLEDSQEYETRMENSHIQKPSKSSPCMASQQSEAVGTILTPILQMAMLQLHRLINATKLMSTRFEPTALLLALTLCYFLIHSLTLQILNTSYEPGTVLGA